jgi:hypothetical protein
MTGPGSAVFREVGPERRAEWVAKGHRGRHFFPHRVRYLPKCGPDGFRLANWMCGIDDPAAMWEVVVHAHPAVLDEFPPDLFFDDDVVWHRQQFGLPGHVASASMVFDGTTLSSITHVSDLVQRISRRREHKTRVEKVFKGWSHMLLNAAVAFGRERGAERVRVPTAALAGRHTDPARDLDLTMFERIYDRTVESTFPARRVGEWWEVRPAEAAPRVVVPARRVEHRARPTAICICHDVERGLGHRDSDPELARRADETGSVHLAAALEIEARLGVRSTCSVVGTLLPEVRAQVAATGRCFAFHSFDHRPELGNQLLRCRELDYRLKGYQPPQGELAEELSDRNLLFHNFEWLASAEDSLGIATPELRNGLVRVPIEFDDWRMYFYGHPYEVWEELVLRKVAGAERFKAFALHDCYAPYWLGRYEGLLERLAELGELRTLDEVAAEVTLAAAV